MAHHDQSDQDARQIDDASAEKLQAYDELLARGESSDSVAAGREALDEEGLKRQRLFIEMLRATWPPIVAADVEAGCPNLRTLGDFRLLRQIGHGGMGVVYEAEQVSLGRRVALKILPFAAMVDKRQLARFKHEAAAAAGLHHPHIVPVLAFGSEDGVYYYAMQYVAGEPLNRIIHALCGENGENGVPIAVPAQLQADDGCDQIRCRHYFHAVAELGVQAAEALDDAHQHGVVHRDVKPGNLLLDADGNLWITDFGLARSETDGTLTMSGDVVGTLRYMSPEQASGKRAAAVPATDVYSLGATLYELLTLHPLFGRGEHSDLLRRIAEEDPRSPRRLVTDLPRDMETIVLKALEKRPEDRYETAQAMADDLLSFLRDEPIRAQPPTPRERLIKWSRRHAGVVWAAAAFAALLIVVLSVGSVMLVRAARNAKLAEERALENLYVSNVRLAQQEWENGNLAAVEQLLNAHIPADGRSDLRGWEWDHLSSLCHLDLATLRGHTARIMTVAWSPDGQRIASAGNDFVVKVWNAPTQEELVTLSGHTDLIYSLAWSPDGSQIASTGWDMTVRVWDVASGESLLEIPASDDSLRRVAWSPDGLRLASCGDDALVKVWDAKSGNQLMQLEGHSGVIWSVAWSPDAGRLAAVGNHENRGIQIWDAGTGKRIKQNLVDPDNVDVAWSPDGRELATAGWDQSVQIWDAETGQRREKFEAHNGDVRSVRWSPDGAKLATAGGDGDVKTWDARDGRLLNVLRGHLGAVWSIDWRSDGKRLASGSSDSTVKIWDPEQEQPSMMVLGRGDFSWSSDGRLATVIDNDGDDESSVLQIMDVESSAIQRLRLPRSDNFTIGGRIVPSPDGSRIACEFESSDDPDCAAKVFDLATLAEIVSFEEPHLYVDDIDWSPDVHYLAAATSDGRDDGYLIIWEMATGRKLVRLKSDPPVSQIAWSPDGTRVAGWGNTQIAKIWEVGSWREVFQLVCEPNSFGEFEGGENMVAWTPDGSRLAAGTARGRFVMWDASTSHEVLSFKAHAARIYSVAISPDGLRIATGSQDSSVKIWDTAGRQLLTLRGHDGTVDAVVWSPNGAWLVTSGGDGLRIWDGSKDWRTD